MFSYMSRGKIEWNCWSLPYIFCSRRLRGINNDKNDNKYNNTNTRKKATYTTQDQIEFGRLK